ncbi:hypothetical protein [Rhodopirellula bahusiensis]|uniref:Uncharacterized protein n=1 Tax=Rhodopirellula bahusiensis TaxID=2014065 RepID=A0A2G1W8M4_9BACT|nr:hypothetical protein [Rhodopirellula bahusiensis]PHQ35180.1 hypothetical protein CEE69_12275 [Rhodopirellula bahusiensis]
MRKPFYRKSRGSWYFNAKLSDGRYRQVELSRDRDEAFRIWEEHYRPRQAKRHEPVGQREVIVTKTKTVTKTVVQSPASEPARKPENVRGRYAQFERLLLLAELLAPLRRGATAGDLYRDCCDLLGRVVCERTIERDLEFLHQVGTVQTDDHRRYRWNGASVRSVVMERMNEAIAG